LDTKLTFAYFVHAWQAEAVTLTVAEAFQIAKEILEKEVSNGLSSSEHPTTSAMLSQPHSLPSAAVAQQV